MSYKNVLVVGGAGNLGCHIVNALLEGGFNVTVLTRNSSTSTFPTTVKVVRSDYSEPSLVQSLKGQDAVVATVGRTAILEQSKLIDAAVKAGVKRFIPSEFGADTTNPKAVDIVPVYKPKVEIISQLKEKAAANSNFTWTGIATGAFLDFGVKTGILSFDLNANKVILWNEGKDRVSFSTLANVGRSVAATLANPAETANKFIFVHSFVLTPREIQASIEKATGKPLSVYYTTTKRGIDDGRSQLEQGDQTGTAKLLSVVIFDPKFGSNFEENPNLMNKTFGLPQEDLDEVIKEVVEGKRP